MTAPDTAPTTATKSDIITNLDAFLTVRATSGQGGLGVLKRMQSTITPAASQATSVLNRMVRVPSNAVIQKVALGLDAAATTLTFNVGYWYSDVNDGTGVLNQGNLTAISSAFHAFALLGSNFTFTQSGVAGHVTAPGDGTTLQLGQGLVDITFANAGGALTDGQYLPSQSNLPIWQAIANSLALQTTPVGAFTQTSQQAHFNTASAGGSVFVRSDDPGGFFDICVQLHATGSAANVKMTMQVDLISPV